MTVGSDLIERVKLYDRNAAENAKGEQSKQWVFFGEFWAQAIPLRGREFFAAAQEQSEITIRFRLRYRGDLNSRMRLEWKGQPYDVAAPPMPVQREWIDLMCKAGTRDGRITNV